MQEEFLTSTGKVFIKDDVLYIKQTTVHRLRSITRYLLPVFFTICFISKLFNDPSPKRNLGLVIYGFGALLWGVLFVIDLFSISFSNQILLRSISYFKTENNSSGTPNKIILTLHSGKKRELVFYGHKTHLEDFTKALTACGIPMQDAWRLTA